MKTAVSLPDEVFARADRYARRMGRSRSGLYAEAIDEYLVRHDPDAVTAKLDQIASELNGPTDEFVTTAARQVLERTDW